MNLFINLFMNCSRNPELFPFVFLVILMPSDSCMEYLKY